MARPEKIRKVGCIAGGRGFKPVGRPARELEQAHLRLDELEALRLADVEGLYQEEAAARMGVSRATFARIVSRARQVVATALLEEQLLVIADGPVSVEAGEPLPCPVHGRRRRQGRGCHCDGEDDPAEESS